VRNRRKKRRKAERQCTASSYLLSWLWNTLRGCLKSILVISTPAKCGINSGRNPSFCLDFSVAEFTPPKAGLHRNDKYDLLDSLVQSKTPFITFVNPEVHYSSPPGYVTDYITGFLGQCQAADIVPRQIAVGILQKLPPMHSHSSL
jgi:hypothetical protein